VQGRIDHMAFDARTDRLFVAALGDNTVQIVDVKQGKRLHSISGLHEPQGILYLPDVNRLYVANSADGTVQVFDGTTYGLIESVSLGSDADNVRFDPEHREIYIGHGSGALGVLREDGSAVGDIKLDAHPESFQLETLGHRIFVNLPGSKNVAVVDRDTKAVVTTWSTGTALANFPMVLDEQGHRLLIVCGGGLRRCVLRPSVKKSLRERWRGYCFGVRGTRPCSIQGTRPYHYQKGCAHEFLFV
jgi:DNA-binding beta-propeller fold protein YncE